MEVPHDQFEIVRPRQFGQLREGLVSRDAVGRCQIPVRDVRGVRHVICDLDNLAKNDPSVDTTSTVFYLSGDRSPCAIPFIGPLETFLVKVVWISVSFPRTIVI